MDNTTIKTIDHLCKAFVQKDSNAFSEIFAEDATYMDSLYGIYKGRKAIQDFHARCHEEGTGYKFLPVSYLSGDDGLAGFEWKLEFVPLSGKGEKVRVEGASFFTETGGKIVSYREYSDSIAILIKGKVPDDKVMRFYRHKYGGNID